MFAHHTPKREYKVLGRSVLLLLGVTALFGSTTLLGSTLALAAPARSPQSHPAAVASQGLQTPEDLPPPSIRFDRITIAEGLAILLAMVGPLFLSDLIFALTAIAFMLLLAVLLAAQKNRRVKTTWVVGVLWLLLAVPFALQFSRFLGEGRGVWTLIALSLVLLYMLAKALLDFVFRVDFERNRMARLASLTLMCLALSSLVWIAFGIHPSWGIPVLIAFGVLVVSVIVMYRNEIT